MPPDFVMRLARITPDADKPIMCQATAPKRQCREHADVATYRAERVDAVTGEVFAKYYCTNAAAAWAARYQVAFPPGRIWRDACAT